MLHNVRQTGGKLATRSAGIGRVVALWLIMSTSAVAPCAEGAGVEQRMLSTVVIRGSTTYTPGELFTVYRDQLGQPITPDNERSIARALEDIYLRDGYARPQLRVSERLALHGILHVDVHEPRITRVTISGNPGPHRPRLQSIGVRLSDGKPIRPSIIQQALRQMRELPGLKVTATTKRDASQRNGYELAVDTAYEPVDGFLRLSNRGTEEIGPHFALGQLVMNDLLGRGEKLGLVSVSAIQYGEHHGSGAFVDTPLGARGTRAKLMGFRSSSDPSEEPTNQDLGYHRERLTLNVTHPLRTGSVWTALVNVALEMEDLEIERTELLLRGDRLRVFELGTRLERRFAHTQNVALLELRRGINGLGSALEGVNLTGDPRREDFLLARLQYTQLARLREHWTLRCDVLGQYTGYVLPHSERFKIGGERLGRGFEITEISGDRGLGGKVELRRDIPWADSSMGKPSIHSFYDIGAAWRQDQGGRESASTAGIGLGLHGERVTGSVEVAKPLTRADIEGRKSTGVFAEVSFQF